MQVAMVITKSRTGIFTLKEKKNKDGDGKKKARKRKGNVYMSSYRSKVFAYDVDEGLCHRKNLLLH